MSSGQQNSQRSESALQYQERMRSTQSLQDNWSHGGLCPCPDCHRNYREADRATDRRAYVRAHAPALLAALVNGPGYASGLDRLRAAAIRETGLLFDETEAK